MFYCLPMRLLLGCTALVCSLWAGSCGGSAEGGDVLIETFSPQGGGLVWTCPDGTEFFLDTALSRQSTICLGIDASECGESAGPSPGNPECDSPSFNAFKNTCIEEYFSCFQPSGTCTIDNRGNQRWSSGALQDREYQGHIASFFPDAESPPCIVADLGGGLVRYRQQ